MKFIKTLMTVLLIGSLPVGALQAAEDYPNRPIRLVVPYSPGGGTDVAARFIAEELGKELGQPVIVENRAGGNGIVGTTIASKAAPDGYTILLSLQATMALNPNLYKATSYDPLKDFEHFSIISNAPYVLTASGESGIENLGQLKKASEKKSIHYASGASAAYLAAELVKKTVGFDMKHIPYGGSGPAIADVISNRVPIMISSPVSILPQVKDGTLVPLAVTSLERVSSLPEVPTLAEEGYEGFEVVGWYALSAPANTPQDILITLNEATIKALKTPSVMQGFENVGVQADKNKRDLKETKDFIENELKIWSDEIRSAGIKAQ